MNISLTYLTKVKRGEKQLNRHWRHHMGPFGCWTGIMSVEEEIKMLEKMKERLETHLANVNERLEKLKE